MTNMFRTLGRDERGASIIELALVAPFLAAMVIGMVDISRAYSTKLQLEQAAQRAIEKAMQGKKTTTLFNTLKAEGASAAGVAQSAVAVDFWLECNGARVAGYDDTVCTGTVPYSRHVSIDITKTYTPMFSTKFAGANADGSYTLHGRAGVRVQ